MVIIINYIFVKDPKKIRKEGFNSPSFKNEIDIDDIEADLNSPQRSKVKTDDMNIIKDYIGNLLYEKWFLENFTKNNDCLDRLPLNVVSKQF